MNNPAAGPIHSIPVDELTGAISEPIYQRSAFVQEARGINKGYAYAWTNNPTRASLEKIIDKLKAGSVGLKRVYKTIPAL